MNIVKYVRTRLHFIRKLPLEMYPYVPDLFLQYRDWVAAPDVKRIRGGYEYKGKFYPDYLTVGGACHAVFPVALKYCKGQGVDIGAGYWPLPGATPVDPFRGPGQQLRLEDIGKATLDYMFSSHCLEHIVDWRAALSDWNEKLKTDGIIFLYLPHPDCGLWHPGSPFVGSGHKWIPEINLIKRFLESMGHTIIACDPGPDSMSSFFIASRRNASPQFTE
jgi:SAM-dependent methyltransferase